MEEVSVRDSSCHVSFGAPSVDPVSDVLRAGACPVRWAMPGYLPDGSAQVAGAPAPYLRLWPAGASTQLGKAFRSNNSGDGPSSCSKCGKELPRLWKMCGACYDRGEELGEETCGVCHSTIGNGSRTRFSDKKAVGFEEYIHTLTGETLYDHWIHRRDLKRCPVRAGEWVCRLKHCVYREFEIYSRRLKTVRKSQRRRGRKPFVDKTGPCVICGVDLSRSGKVRRCGRNLESIQLFRDELAHAGDDDDEVEPLEVSSALCNRCYMAWYYFSRDMRSASKVGQEDDQRFVEEGEAEEAYRQATRNRDRCELG